MIEKGKEWGEPGVVPPETVSVLSDAQLAASDPTGMYSVRFGDLFYSVGQPRELGIGDQCVVAPIDALECELTVNSKQVVVLAASSILIGTWWRKSWIAVTNAEWIGPYNIAPRSHPNDGRCEVLEFSSKMPLQQRWLARRKMRTGTHVPHPQIETRSVRTASFDIPSSSGVLIDSVKYSQVTHISVRVIPDYWRIII